MPSEKVAMKKEPKAQRLPPKIQTPPPVQLPPDAPEDEETGFNTMLMSSDEFKLLKAKVGIKTPDSAKKAAGVKEKQKEPPIEFDQGDSLRDKETVEGVKPQVFSQKSPAQSILSQRLGAQKDIKASERKRAEPQDERVKEAPAPQAQKSKDLAIERVISKAADATNEELKSALIELTPDKAEEIRKIGSELVCRIARSIVPQVAERLVKEEIARLKKELS